MKQLLIILLIGMMVFSGCDCFSSSLIEESSSVAESEPSSEESTKESISEESTTEEFITEEPTTEFVTVTLFDKKVAIGKEGNIWHIRNEVIENMQSPELYILGNALLLNMATMDNNYGCENIFKLVSMHDGSLIGEFTLKTSGFITVQVSEDKVGVCDSGMGQIVIFDKLLQPETIYQLEADWEMWYLSSNLQTLYQFHSMSGMTATTLYEDGTYSEKSIVLDNVTNVNVKATHKNSIVFSYTDIEKQKVTSRSLDLKSGRMELLPVVGEVSDAVYSNGTWLIHDGTNWEKYYVITNGERKLAYWEQNRFELLTPQGHLFSLSQNGRTLNLYEVDGTFISKCEFVEGEDSFIGPSILWSDFWNGYIFLQYGSDMKPKLMFWDIEESVEGYDFPLAEEIQQGGMSAESYLYERVEEMEKNFGVEISIADECRLEYDTFSSYEVNDTETIEQALDCVEQALSSYPSGFFEQLCYGNIQQIQIELVGGITVANTETYSGSYSAFAVDKNDHYLIVLDSHLAYEGTLYHEIAHIIDARLAWDSNIREDALFDEEKWLSLQPEGFSYPYTYGILPEEIQAFVNSGYFVMEYSCRYPTEDRATLMEAAMCEEDYTFSQNPKLYEKLEYYSACIRDCFDTTGWENVLKWEEFIK